MRPVQGRCSPCGMPVLKASLALLGEAVLAGTFGFWAMEKGLGTLLDSFYFTLVTVAMVG